MSKEKRQTMLNFAVTEREAATIQEKMKNLGVRNQSAFLRTMALNGYMFKLDLPEIREMTRLLRNMTCNMNQLTKRVNAGGNLYETELEEIKGNQQELWSMLKEILHRLDTLRPT